MDAMDPYSMYMMTEQFVSLSPGDVSDIVRERMIAMWNSVGGLNHREGELLAKGVPTVKIKMIRNFLWPSKKGRPKRLFVRPKNFLGHPKEFLAVQNKN